MRVAAVSPHFDDVPLSLGLSLRAGALAAHEVVVPVVFDRTNWTRWWHPTAGRAPVVSRVRAVEEWVASRLFGFRRGPAGGFAECILRTGDLDPDLLLDATFEPRDDPLFLPVQDFLRSVVDSAEVTLVPLGAGDHVDHRLVTAAAAELVEAGERRIAFYEDRPYAARLADDELAACAIGTGLALDPVPVSGPVDQRKAARLARCYPSQIDAEFRTLLALDVALRRNERLWVPRHATVIDRLFVR